METRVTLLGKGRSGGGLVAQVLSDWDNIGFRYQISRNIFMQNWEYLNIWWIICPDIEYRDICDVGYP